MEAEKKAMELESYFDFLSPEDIRIKGTRIGIETVDDTAPALGTPDPEILQWIEREGYVLVSRNRRTIHTPALEGCSPILPARRRGTPAVHTSTPLRNDEC